MNFIVLHDWGADPKTWDDFDDFEEALKFRDELYPDFPIYQRVKEEMLYHLPDGSVIKGGNDIAVWPESTTERDRLWISNIKLVEACEAVLATAVCNEDMSVTYAVDGGVVALVRGALASRKLWTHFFQGGEDNDG